LWYALVVRPAGRTRVRCELVAVVADAAGQERDAFERDRAERVPADDARVAGRAGDPVDRGPADRLRLEHLPQVPVGGFLTEDDRAPRGDVQRVATPR
jgi:hypothetical protein